MSYIHTLTAYLLELQFGKQVKKCLNCAAALFFIKESEDPGMTLRPGTSVVK